MRPPNEHEETGVRFTSILMSDLGGVQISFSVPAGRAHGITEHRTLTFDVADLPIGVYDDFIEYAYLFYEHVERVRLDRHKEIVERETQEHDDDEPDEYAGDPEIIERPTVGGPVE